MFLCPYCLTKSQRLAEALGADGKSTFASCPTCQELVPPRYLQNYEKYVSLVISLVGLRKHGKTVYVSSLLLELEEIGNVWRDFTYGSLDLADSRTIREKIDPLKAGKLPDSTEKIFPKPVVLQLDNVPRVGKCRLLLYDTGGEAFTDVADMAEYGSYTTASRFVVWIVSLADLESPLELAELLDVYLETMLRLKVKTRDQTLLVVLTKGDIIKDWQGVPNAIRRCLDQEADLTSPAIWKHLDTASQEIEGWLDSGPYHNFARQARLSFGAVRYCAVSALGMDPKGKQEGITVRPHGVLIPLYWLWAFHGRPLVVLEDGICFSLAEAVGRAKPGATLRLTAGHHVLDEPLRLNQPLRLLGAGVDKTFIQGKNADFLLCYGAAGQLRAADISFRHSATTPANVLVVQQGEIELLRCGFTGAVSDEQRSYGGNGLLLTGQVTGTVQECKFWDNQCNGIALDERARPRLHGNVCKRNGDAGIAYFGQSGGLARKNLCSGNAEYGIAVEGQAQPELQDNDCQGNGNDYSPSAQALIKPPRLPEHVNSTGAAVNGDGTPAASQAEPTASAGSSSFLRRLVSRLVQKSPP